MYTWGYIKENTLSKLNMDEEEANQQGFLSRFPYCANEAMTQICSAIKPCIRFMEIEIAEENENVNVPITLPDDFLSFSDDVVSYKNESYPTYLEVGDDFLKYHGYNQVICFCEGTYRIPYNTRWFFFTKELHNATIIPAPADVCDALPSYIASQCLKIDDEVKAATFRNEYEMFLSRIDDTSFKAQRTLHVGGGW